MAFPLISIALIPVYGMLGYVLSSAIRGNMNLPWYLTEKQFYGLSFSALALALGWYTCRLLQIFFVTHSPPADSLVGMAQLSVWYVGYMLPFVQYRNQQLKDDEYNKTLKLKASSAPGWELPEGLLDQHK